MEIRTTGPERAMLVNMLEINRESLIECVEGLTESDPSIIMIEERW